MPARDTYHQAVKNALIKDGWIILADPYITKLEVRSQKSDRGAVGLATYVFVTGIYALLQKHFANQGGVLYPFFFDNQI